MSKHTPGPWFVAPRNEVNSAGHNIAMIADLDWGQYRDAEDNGEAEFEANARLIAAAPDLLEALKAAMAFLDENVADPDITAGMAQAYIKLRDINPKAIIAKAEGKE
jgi:hypothetical protein